MATAIIIVLALQLILRHNFEQGLQHYSDRNVLERFEPISLALTERYAAQGDWQFIRGTRTLSLANLLQPQSTPGFPNRNGKLNAHLISRELASARVLSALTILDVDFKWVAGAPYNHNNATKEIIWNEEIIGYLTLAPLNRLTQKIDRRFSEQQNSIRIWASLSILLAALLSSLLISRSLGKPIKNLNEHVQKLSDGNYDATMTIQSSDELGSLAKNVNKLAGTLQTNREERRQWISDISHELRTPVSVLRAEMECIEDGLQPLNLETITNLKSEVERINLLIDDLHQLSQADHGNLTVEYKETNLDKEIKQCLQSHHDQFKQKEFSISTDLDNLPEICCDPNRIRQVINNILQNTLRYTDAPGKLHISGQALDDKITLVFEDSAPGVPDASISHLFDRLYRVEPSRNRKTGASGLGLSICKAIIKVHKGKIAARKSALGGLAIHIELPINHPNDTQ